jgi:hypothetical protein
MHKCCYTHGVLSMCLSSRVCLCVCMCVCMCVCEACKYTPSPRQQYKLQFEPKCWHIRLPAWPPHPPPPPSPCQRNLGPWFLARVAISWGVPPWSIYKMHTHTHTQTHNHVTGIHPVYVYINIYLYVYVCVCVCVRACVYVCTPHIYTSLHTNRVHIYTHIPKTEPNHRVQTRTLQPPTLLGGCCQEPVTCLGPWRARSGQLPVTNKKKNIHMRIPKNQCPSISTIQSYLCNVSRSVTHTVRSAAWYKNKNTDMYEFRKLSALVYRVQKVTGVTCLGSFGQCVAPCKVTHLHFFFCKVTHYAKSNIFYLNWLL